jgi:hypothetical protein
VGLALHIAEDVVGATLTKKAASGRQAIATAKSCDHNIE